MFLKFYFMYFIIVVGYCLDVWKTKLQDYESSTRNCVSESAPNFAVSRAHLHANQAIVKYFMSALSHLLFLAS